jgi:cytochrome c-type biogenesis protein CcmF
MTELLGNISLGLAMLVATAGIFVAMASARFESRGLLRAARGLIVTFGLLMTLASGALLAALVRDQFSIAYVAHYTERALPLAYKLAAFWAGQEGSLLLWAWLLAAMAVIYVVRDHSPAGPESAGTIATLFAVLGFFAALMLFAANPFTLIDDVPLDGHGLNPMLQDPAMVAHPPMLFLGYAGFTIPFAMAVGALIAGRRDNAWIEGTRRWNLASWLFLSIGILLGAQWAYVELGWGGYWAWDPVENASLLPWLTGTALLHSIMVQKHRGMLKVWNVSLIALTFVLCIFGTYLTRSGVIQSVHSFGQSVIGTFFLTFLAIATGVSVLLIVWRRKVLKAEHELVGMLGREGFFLATNVLLVGIMLVTLVGTIFPILSGAFGRQAVTVGPSFYNKVVAPLGLLVVAMMACGPVLIYGADAAKRLARGMILPGLLALAAVGAFCFYGIRNAWALICVAIVTAAVFNVLLDLVHSFVQRIRAHNETPLTATIKLLGNNHRRYGGQIVHIGIVMIVAGIAGSSLFNVKETFQVHEGESVKFAGQTLKFDKLAEVRHGNYTAVEATINLTDSAGNTKIYRPERRFYDKAEEANSEVAIGSTWKQDVYFTLAGWEQNGKVSAIQAIVNPLVSWIWTGGLLMTVGAVIGLLPRIGPRSAEVQTEVREKAQAKLQPKRQRTPRVPLPA